MTRQGQQVNARETRTNKATTASELKANVGDQHNSPAKGMQQQQ